MDALVYRADRIDELGDFLRREFAHRLGRIGHGKQASDAFAFVASWVRRLRMQEISTRTGSRMFFRHNVTTGVSPLALRGADADRRVNFAVFHGLCFSLHWLTWSWLYHKSNAGQKLPHFMIAKKIADTLRSRTAGTYRRQRHKPSAVLIPIQERQMAIIWC